MFLKNRLPGCQLLCMSPFRRHIGIYGYQKHTRNPFIHWRWKGIDTKVNQLYGNISDPASPSPVDLKLPNWLMPPILLRINIFIISVIHSELCTPSSFFLFFFFNLILFYFIITLGIHLQYSYTVLTYNKTTKFILSCFVTIFLSRFRKWPSNSLSLPVQISS